ncbi:MAG: hypothetical protein GX142_04375 [Chloroflexi bacterium]|jgi:hypothetical protein|nr:hypothetical protein [Chloroflexota bacterium]
MGHFSDEINKDEFMSASAEEWSKPTPPAERPPVKPDPTDRWGSPIADKMASSDPARWGSPSASAGQKGGSKWWVILIILLVVVCLCACLIMAGLPILGLNFIPKNLFGFLP